MIDVNEAAAMLGIKTATLRNWAYQRRIPKVKLGGPHGALRFRVGDLRHFIRAGLQAPIAERALGARGASDELATVQRISRAPTDTPTDTSIADERK